MKSLSVQFKLSVIWCLDTRWSHSDMSCLLLDGELGKSKQTLKTQKQTLSSLFIFCPNTNVTDVPQC